MVSQPMIARAQVSRAAQKYFSILVMLFIFILLCAFLDIYDPSRSLLYVMGITCGFVTLAVTIIVFVLSVVKTSQSESKFRHTSEVLAAVMTGVNDGVFDQDFVRNTINYSDSYRTILGFTSAELGHDPATFDTLVHPDDRVESREVLRRYLARETPIYYNVFRLMHKDGHYVWVMSRGIAMWDEQGGVERLIGSHADITLQKEREEELRHLVKENEFQKMELAMAKEKAESANRAKSEFLATMSHEIRTPLNVVVGLGQLLINTAKTPQNREMAETLYANADILLRLVNDLLDLSRIEASQIELDISPFTLGAVFDQLRNMFEAQAAAKNLTLTIHDKTDHQVLSGDHTRLQQILVNLIGNAIKFTAQGNVSVVAESAPIDDQHVALRISVVDTGVGIPEDKLALIFDKFIQADQSISRRFGGSGLGLAISKSLVQIMGGDLAVTSKVDHGSVFTLSLSFPVVALAKLASSDQSLLPETNASRGTILVVDDYAANVMVVSLMLEHFGYDVEAANSGAEAIYKIEARQTPYTAILMDVQMHGMDGFEATRRIRAIEATRNFRHFIIGVTAHAFADDRLRCLNAGMDDYMSKPVNPDLLAVKLNQISENRLTYPAA